MSKIISNKHNICPVCDGELKVYETEGTDDSYIELWECTKCKCTGKQYFDFTDHYDVYAEDGETRIDSEDDSCFPYLKRDRLLILLGNALSAIHEKLEDSSFESLIHLELGITRDEHEMIQKEVNNG